ncbi:MAG: D-alanyl-D-alanine carboxypeptidase, partial [Nitratireductor sp.]|nr:D-alanyl-D-alanine carboxypeptidase [Nitratireductor sp.]
MNSSLVFFRRLLPLLALLGLLTSIVSAQAQLYSTKAKQALLIDADTSTVLFAKEADAQIPPASLAKLMTMEVVFNSLKTGRLNLSDTFFISENAWR